MKRQEQHALKTPKHSEAAKQEGEKAWLRHRRKDALSLNTSLSPSIVSFSGNKSSENLGVSVEYILFTNGIINLLFLACLCPSSL